VTLDRAPQPDRRLGVDLDPCPDHHLWRNGRIWWIAFTFHTAEGRKYRIRRSLRTSDVGEARANRDALLSEYARRPGWRLALRFPRATLVRAVA
jgi:hypothetical protein